MMRGSVVSLLIALSLSTAGCGLRGDLYLDEPGQPDAEPAVDPGIIQAEENELDVTDISDPDLLKTEEEASGGNLDDADESP